MPEAQSILSWGGGGGRSRRGWGEECKSALMDFGRPDRSKNYPKTRQDRKVVWVAVNRVVWLQFYNWQCHGMEENNDICPGHLFSAGVSIVEFCKVVNEFPILTCGLVG